MVLLPSHFWIGCKRLLIFKLTVVTFFHPICRSIVTEEIRVWIRWQQWRKWQKRYYRLWNQCHFDTRRSFEGLRNEALHGDRHTRSFPKKYKYGHSEDQHSSVQCNLFKASKRWTSWLRSIGEVLFIRDGREKLTCKACMVSRFWFLVSVVHNTNCRERSNSKTKTCSCFWIQLWSRLDGRSAKTKNENAFLVFRFCRTNWTDLRAANFTELY